MASGTLRKTGIIEHVDPEYPLRPSECQVHRLFQPNFWPRRLAAAESQVKVRKNENKFLRGGFLLEANLGVTKLVLTVSIILRRLEPTHAIFQMPAIA